MPERTQEVVKDMLGKWDGEVIEFGGKADQVRVFV